MIRKETTALKMDPNLNRQLPKEDTEYKFSLSMDVPHPVASGKYKWRPIQDSKI